MACKFCHKGEQPKKKRMSAASAKAKGRRLQQRVRDDLRTLAGKRLDPTDIESCGMGQHGVDVILTRAARDLFGDLAIECKNVEVLNAVGVFQAHMEKYPGKIPVMVHSRNHIEPRVTLLWSDFLAIFRAAKGLDFESANVNTLKRDEVCPTCSNDNKAQEHCGGPWHHQED